MTTRQIPADVAEAAQTARALRTDGQAKIDQAAAISRDIVNRLTPDGWQQLELAELLGLSKQRVHQIVNPAKKKTATRK